MNSLVRGQKLPIFSGGGLPHDRLAVEIASHARLRGAQAERLRDRLRRHRRALRQRRVLPPSLEQGGALERTALFLNLANDPSTQRLLTPRFALSAAEYLAFDLRHARAGDPHRHDQLLRGAARGVVEQGRDPEPQGLPGLHVHGPGHAVRARRPHEGQQGHDDAVADPDHARRRHRPPDPRPDRLHHRRPDRALARPRPARHLSTGECAAQPVASDEGRHRRQVHRTRTTPALASQLYAAYARAAQARVLASVVGVEGLADTDRALPAIRHRLRADAGQPGRRHARSRRAWPSAGGCWPACRGAS